MEYYDQIAPGYNMLYAEEQTEKLKKVREHIKVLHSDVVLDVGCGTGIAAQLFKCKLIGIDPALGMVQQASFPVVCGNGELLPFRAVTFDGVVCVSAFHHMKDYTRALEEMRRVLKPRGWLVITLLKKAREYEIMRSLLLHQSFREVDAGKDSIFIG